MDVGRYRISKLDDEEESRVRSYAREKGLRKPRAMYELLMKGLEAYEGEEE